MLATVAAVTAEKARNATPVPACACTLETVAIPLTGGGGAAVSTALRPSSQLREMPSVAARLNRAGAAVVAAAAGEAPTGMVGRFATGAVPTGGVLGSVDPATTAMRTDASVAGVANAMANETARRVTGPCWRAIRRIADPAAAVDTSESANCANIVRAGVDGDAAERRRPKAGDATRTTPASSRALKWRACASAPTVTLSCRWRRRWFTSRNPAACRQADAISASWFVCTTPTPMAETVRQRGSRLSSSNQGAPPGVAVVRAAYQRP